MQFYFLFKFIVNKFVFFLSANARLTWLLSLHMNRPTLQTIFLYSFLCNGFTTRFFYLLFLPLNLACICCALCNAVLCKVIGPNYKISAGNCIQRFCFNWFEEIVVSLPKPQLHKVKFLESEDSQTGPNSWHDQAAAFNTLDLSLKWLSAAMTHSATALILLAENWAEWHRAKHGGTSLCKGQQIPGARERNTRQSKRSCYWRKKKKGIHNLIFLASNTHPQHTISFVCRKRIVQPSFPLTVSHLRGKKSTAGSIWVIQALGENNKLQTGR